MGSRPSDSSIILTAWGKAKMFRTAIAVLCWFSFTATTGYSLFAADVDPSQGPERIRVEGRTMGPIRYVVTAIQPADPIDPQLFQDSVAETLERINRLMSNYKPDSDISRFNDFDSTEWFKVDPETALVIARSQEISRLSNGAFDITVAPAIDRWKFGPSNLGEEFKIPTEEELQELQSRVGYQMLEVRSDPPAIRKSNPQVSVDLSAIAKGYAVDAVAATLREIGFENFLVEVGGEVYAGGLRDGQQKWRTGVMVPDSASSDDYGEVVTLSNQAIATSGDYENFFVVQGRRYSHTIDPTTCRPIENLVASVSIVADDCMTADAVATAVMVLGPEKGMELCQQMGVELLVKTRNKDFGDQIVSRQTAGFPLLDFDQSDDDKNVTGGRPAANSIWPVFVAATIVILLAVASMAVGSIVGNKPITGSCGGLANRTNESGETVCGVCSKPTQDCPEKE